MVEVVGIRFRKAGKIYYFDPDGESFEKADHVIVETARGVEFGFVVKENSSVEQSDVVSPLKKVMRKATAEDEKIFEENKKKETEALDICSNKIREHNLDMKLIDCETTFDNNKLIFYFTSDGRVDFRELVKELASIFRTRIELRQIGVRDESKMLNGVGICGRCLCCATFLCDFQPVSIKMAKEQNLSLNPAKISGICGRLMCCLKYEENVYEELNKILPHVGDIVKTPQGKGEVLSVNTLKEQVKVAVKKGAQDDPEIDYYPVDSLKVLVSKRPTEKSEAFQEHYE